MRNQSKVSKKGCHCENSEKWVHYKMMSVKKNFIKKTVWNEWVHCRVKSVKNNFITKTVWNEFITKSTELKVKPVKNKFIRFITKPNS